MTSTCLVSGFGSGIYGKDPWGGSLVSAPGGPMPVVLPFDIYCVGPCGPISVLLTHTEVTTFGNGLQFPVDGYSLDQVIRSGPAGFTNEAELYINKAVPQDFTLEFTVNFGDLPNDFNDLVNKHIFIGASDAAGSCAALLFSKVGIAYCGSAHIAGGNIVIDTVLQPLPNSQLLVSEDEYWTIRLAVSTTTGTTYVYITKTSELLSIGHQLRYILPSIPSSSAAVVPPDRTAILVRGTADQPSSVSLNSICLGTGLLIPNIAPKADPGADQATQLCTVLQLDGSASFDPEGAALTYKWRLIDAPDTSQYTINGSDGLTYPLLVPTGFTNKFYSASLALAHSLDPLVANDVLVVDGDVFNITSTATDLNGFYVVIDSYSLPDNFSTKRDFKVFRQRGINGPTSAKPTFYPDVAGIFKFDLIVFDGGLFSLPESMVANVSVSPVARGVTPNLSFLWNYLSDFWKLLEEGQERVEVFWGGLAQVAAAEMLNLWQVEYNKSLRDIQRTFQRKWLSYALFMQEDPNLMELSKVEPIWDGLRSVALPLAGVGSVSGTQLVLELDALSDPLTINFPYANPYTPAQLQGMLSTALKQQDARINVRLIEDNAATNAYLRIDAPYRVKVSASSTSPLFLAGAISGPPSGTAGAVVGVKTYKVEKSLQDVSVKSGDFLVLGDHCLRIARIVDDAGDALPYQRITVLDELPTPSIATWTIASKVSSKSLDFFTGLVSSGDIATIEVFDQVTQTLLDVDVPVLGVSSETPNAVAVDPSLVGPYLQNTSMSVFLRGITRKKYIPIDPLVVDVPFLSERIKVVDDEETLRRSVDFHIESYRGQPCLRFVTGGLPDVWGGLKPPKKLWAEYTYLDNRPSIEANFGIPAEFTLDDLSELPSNIDYLSSVRGLWYAYFNGPTVFNLRVGTQILLGLPFAEEAGTIVEIRKDFSDTLGRVLVQDLANSAITRSYSFPAKLDLEVNPDTKKEYALGDVVTQFAPLVKGVEVLDYINDPKWFQGYLNQGAFYEVEKFFKFLVRVDSLAFNLNALLFVQNFIRRIKPKYTYPLFVVLARVGETEVSTTDDIDYSGGLYLFEGAVFRDSMGAANLIDDPRAAGGGWRSSLDSDQNPATSPVSPDPEIPVFFGVDKKFLAPEDAIHAKLEQVVAAVIPQADGIFYADGPAMVDSHAYVFNVGDTDYTPATPGLRIGLSLVAAGNVTLASLSLRTFVQKAAPTTTFNIVVKVNGATASTTAVTLPEGDHISHHTVNVPVTVGDSIEVYVVSSTGNVMSWFTAGIMVTLGEAGVVLAADTPVAAGTYRTYRRL